MRSRNVAPVALVALAALVGSCGDQVTAPASRPAFLFNHTAAHPSVRFSEIHYDNAGTDAGEAIEVSGPAGTDLTGWSIVLYNGANGLSYDTDALTGTIPATANCSARGVVFLNYAVNGIQNGSPDGFALINGLGQVVEFLSYEGVFAALNGPAAGMTSTDIGVTENGSEPIGRSLQRTPTGSWNAVAIATFGSCNDDDTGVTPAVVDSVAVSPAASTITQGGTVTLTATAYDASDQAIGGVTFTWSSDAMGIATVDAAGVVTGVAPGDATISATAPNGVFGTATVHVNPSGPGLPPTRMVEIHYDNTGTDIFEAIEVEGPAGMDLNGWSIVLYNGNGGATYNTRTLSGTIPDFCSGRGVIAFQYPQDGIQNGSPDGFALVDALGQVVEFLSYEGAFTAVGGPAGGLTSTDIGVVEVTSTPIGRSLQRDATGAWAGPVAHTMGACNNGEGPPAPPQFAFQFSGRDAIGDPPLPVGFQDQLFVTVRDGSGNVVTTPITWSSDTPAFASIDQRGVFTGMAAGTAVFRATTDDGTGTGTFSLPIRVATAGAAQYGNHAEFGEPADGDGSDDLLVRHAQFTASYNPVRNIPNWVSYNLDASHFGAEDRCDCFTFDPALPPSAVRYTTADYTGAGAAAGFGIDRGHLARSFDRTTGSLDNAFTFYFTNIVPQAADLNQGPWAAFESHLGDLARLQNMEVYLVTGASGSRGTVKDEGVITIPASTWKVAVIMPRDQGLADVHTYQDVQVIAVIMPNEPGIRNVDWNTYRTTVDAVETLSGYDVLALLPDQVEIAVESGTAPPNPVVNGPFTSDEGASVDMSAAGSTDPDGDALTFAWDFGDGATGSGPTVSHTYAQNGVFTVRLVATDTRGLFTEAVTMATVSNVAPSIGAFAGATLLPGETYTAGGSFTDPGADIWTGTVDYGDGGGQAPLALSGMSFSLSHLYMATGTFTVTVRVTDDQATSAGTQTVTVLTPVQGIERAMEMVAQLAAGGLLNHGNANSLTTKLENAKRQLERGHVTPAVNQLEALLHELDAMVRSGRLSAADAGPLRDLVERLIESLDGP